VSDVFEEPDGATPLTPEERRHLIPAHIAYRHELNEAEQDNIARAQDWALGRRRRGANAMCRIDLCRCNSAEGESRRHEDKPGLRIEINPDVARGHLAPGESWWG
jgi:hypothetical protein